MINTELQPEIIELVKQIDFLSPLIESQRRARELWVINDDSDFIDKSIAEELRELEEAFAHYNKNGDHPAFTAWEVADWAIYADGQNKLLGLSSYQRAIDCPNFRNTLEFISSVIGTIGIELPDSVIAKLALNYFRYPPWSMSIIDYSAEDFGYSRARDANQRAFFDYFGSLEGFLKDFAKNPEYYISAVLPTLEFEGWRFNPDPWKI